MSPQTAGIFGRDHRRDRVRGNGDPPRRLREAFGHESLQRRCEFFGLQRIVLGPQGDEPCTISYGVERALEASVTQITLIDHSGSLDAIGRTSETFASSQWQATPSLQGTSRFGFRSSHRTGGSPTSEITGQSTLCFCIIVHHAESSHLHGSAGFAQRTGVRARGPVSMVGAGRPDRSGPRRHADARGSTASGSSTRTGPRPPWRTHRSHTGCSAARPARSAPRGPRSTPTDRRCRPSRCRRRCPPRGA